VTADALDRQNDGHFFIPVNEFKEAFDSFHVNPYKEQWYISYFEGVDAGNAQYNKFTFTVHQKSDVWLSANIFDNRMFPDGGCANWSIGRAFLKKGSSTLDSSYVYI